MLKIILTKLLQVKKNANKTSGERYVNQYSPALLNTTCKAGTFPQYLKQENMRSTCYNIQINAQKWEVKHYWLAML